ncbi:MAG: phytanoyl-CoA dioxygenase family protein [Myxococcales bacterium]|nr:phytanoyl-CoA dioxygenase family protein [Myxococcales bacterium]
MEGVSTSALFSAGSSGLAERVTEAVNAEGYAVVTGLLDARGCDALVSEVDRVERDHGIDFGKNDFEGFQTRRIFNLIQRSPRFRELVVDERMLGIIESILGVDFLLSGTTSMHLGPGETPQLLHADDGMITLPRPHIATLLTTLWALSDFEDDNGATRLVPRSHLRPEMPRPGEAHETIAAEMPAGSVLFLHGSTWHGGGANTTSDRERYGLSIQFVAGWCRQQQNLMLGTDPELVATYPRRLQELIGYSLYQNVMGHVDREHPLTLLGQDVQPDMVWDRMGNEEKK